MFVVKNHVAEPRQTRSYPPELASSGIRICPALRRSCGQSSGWMLKTACRNGKDLKFLEYFGSVNSMDACVTSQPRARSTSDIASLTHCACWVWVLYPI